MFYHLKTNSSPSITIPAYPNSSQRLSRNIKDHINQQTNKHKASWQLDGIDFISLELTLILCNSIFAGTTTPWVLISHYLMTSQVSTCKQLIVIFTVLYRRQDLLDKERLCLVYPFLTQHFGEEFQQEHSQNL